LSLNFFQAAGERFYRSFDTALFTDERRRFVLPV
jgi:hypothetical protein